MLMAPAVPPRRQAVVAMLVASLLAACAPLPPGQREGVRWEPSPNFDARRPNFIVIHQTSNDDVDTALATLTSPRRKVSAHYLIGRDGEVIQLVAEGARAWHAGASWWGGHTDLNSASIGIELDNNGEEPFAEPQIAALLVLLRDLVARHRIPPPNILGHGDIAPGRKVDPSRHFPWATLAVNGFGLWCALPPDAPPEGFDAQLALHALGYDIANPAAARAAFRRHFLAAEDEGELRTAELALLHCLLQKRAVRTGATLAAPAMD